jgi:hypothetical protein
VQSAAVSADFLKGVGSPDFFLDHVSAAYG